MRRRERTSKFAKLLAKFGSSRNGAWRKMALVEPRALSASAVTWGIPGTTLAGDEPKPK
jgi:hypothetical protein